MNTLDMFLMTFSNKNNLLIAKKSKCHYFSQLPKLPKNVETIQSINIVMNNKSTQNTQENVFKHSFIEFFNISCHFQVVTFYKINKSARNERNIILDRTFSNIVYLGHWVALI